MKIEAPVNANYAAVVIRTKTILPLEDCDNIVGMPIMGLQAIVSKDTQIGEMGVIFPAETQLSLEYTKQNNLYRHADLNAEPDKAGYLEDNRRVRAIKMRKHRSDALYMPLSSLEFTGFDVSHLKEGDTFDTLNGIEICKKYVIVTNSREARVQLRKESRVDKRFFPEHIDTDNFFRSYESLNKNADVVVTQKVHGTSIRIANTIVKKKLSLRDKIAKKFGVAVIETEFSEVYGSRKVIKDANNKNQQHYYDSDLWSLEGAKLNGLIPQNYIVYGELIGWTPSGEAIQKNYTYNQLPGTCKLYIYRVAIVNAQGTIADLSWDALKEFCDSIGVAYVPEMWRGKLRDFDAWDYLDTKFSSVRGGYRWRMEDMVPLAPESPCDEGVCIRFEGMIPQIYKAKSPIFLAHETSMLDVGAEDIESIENEDVP